MRSNIQLLLLGEAACFAAAGATHFGILLHGFEHQAAATAESTIAAVLLVGFVLTLVMPLRTRTIALAAQALALLGTLVGAFTIAIGIGPRTVPDIVFHIAILCVLAWGLLATQRRPATATR